MQRISKAMLPPDLASQSPSSPFARPRFGPSPPAMRSVSSVTAFLKCDSTATMVNPRVLKCAMGQQLGRRKATASTWSHSHWEVARLASTLRGGDYQLQLQAAANWAIDSASYVLFCTLTEQLQLINATGSDSEQTQEFRLTGGCFR